MSDDVSDAEQDQASAADEATDERPLPSVPEPTGVPTVDVAVERLAELDALPTSEHVAIYDAVHRQLQDALADLDGA